MNKQRAAPRRLISERAFPPSVRPSVRPLIAAAVQMQLLSKPSVCKCHSGPGAKSRLIRVCFSLLIPMRRPTPVSCEAENQGHPSLAQMRQHPLENRVSSV